MQAKILKNYAWLGWQKMPKLNFERKVPYSPKQMLSLVADVESYPDFVPFCSDMEVLQLDSDDANKKACYAIMSIQMGPIAQTYTSEVVIDDQAMTISATALDGPFSHLDSVWSFSKGGRGTIVKFQIDFGFSNRLLGKIAEPIFEQKQEEILDAFMAEAKRRFA